MTANASSKSCSAILPFATRCSFRASTRSIGRRILAQIVYYFVGGRRPRRAERQVSFAVPTGNFGDILAGYYAKRMGLPIERLIIATNVNDILARALSSGCYEPRGVKATQSPSMDIQVSSNFERLLFECSGQDPELIRTLMADFSRDGSFAIPSAILQRIRARLRRPADRRGWLRHGNGARLSRKRHSSSIRTARSASAPRGARSSRSPATPVIALGTAHPAKFPDPVERATGVRPALPAHLADLMDREETIIVLPNNRNAVADYLRQTARAPA